MKAIWPHKVVLKLTFEFHASADLNIQKSDGFIPSVVKRALLLLSYNVHLRYFFWIPPNI